MTSRVDRFLAGTIDRPSSRGNLIFALDATASREGTWDMACQLQAEMFHTVASLGSLTAQLVYYRGMPGAGGECRASSWLADPRALAGLMSKIRCDAGETQIRRVLSHVAQEALHRRVNAVVFVGDACEESRDPLAESAGKLATLRVPAFMFQEGHDPVAQQCFREIAHLTQGAYHQFDQGSASQLGELLRAVAMFSVGGTAALERQNTAAAKLLLAQVKR